MKNYGHKWGTTKPPGLPATARGAEPRGSAFVYLDSARGGFFRRLLASAPSFERGVTILLDNESSGTIGRPANVFNVLPESQRGAAKYISAWGCWQYNRDAWRRNGRLTPWERAAGYTTSVVEALGASAAQARAFEANAYPWEASVNQEVLVPLMRQTRVYLTAMRAAQARGASDAEAQRVGEVGIYLEHSKPAHYATWVSRGARLDDERVTGNAGVVRKMGRELPDLWQRALAGGVA